MYILKNSLISIARNKGRNILIGIIILVIACASTVTLAIRNTANRLQLKSEASTRYGKGLNYEYTENVNGDKMTITLKYGDRKERVITGLKRISKPGLRVYAKADEIPYVLNGLGIAIISTSKGIMTDKLARKNNVGGEVIAYIW